MKRALLILCILASLPLTGFKSDSGGPAGVVLTGGFIGITVESNINRVLFTYPLTGLSMYTASPDAGEMERVNIAVPVRDFSCENEIAYHDFVSLLKSDQFPLLSISIPTDGMTQDSQKSIITIHGLVIDIAGVSRKYDVTCSSENQQNEDSFLVGTLMIRLSDLNIKPPVKYLGMVRIKDEVIVNFGFSFKDYHLAGRKVTD